MSKTIFFVTYLFIALFNSFLFYVLIYHTINDIINATSQKANNNTRKVGAIHSFLKELCFVMCFA